MDTPEKNKKEQAARLLCIGAWHTYSRMTLEESVNLVQGAMERGINHFDMADYWDHEQLNTTRFREIVRILGLPRESYKLGLKVFTTSVETREEVVRRTLDLLGVEYADYVLCSRPNTQETMQQAIEAMNGLVTKGLTRELDFSLWDAPQLKEAYDLMKQQGMSLPKFVQFQYNICRRDVVESQAYHNLFESTGLKLQAAFPLEGGILGGHVTRRRYDQTDREQGIWFHPEDRNIARDSGGIRDEIVRKVPRLIEVARSMNLSPAQLSQAFAATHPYIENVLFGATKLWQLDEALEAMQLAVENPARIREIAGEFYVSGSQAPRLFDFSARML